MRTWWHNEPLRCFCMLRLFRIPGFSKNTTHFLEKQVHRYETSQRALHDDMHLSLFEDQWNQWILMANRVQTCSELQPVKIDDGATVRFEEWLLLMQFVKSEDAITILSHRKSQRTRHGEKLCYRAALSLPTLVTLTLAHPGPIRSSNIRKGQRAISTISTRKRIGSKTSDIH